MSAAAVIAVADISRNAAQSAYVKAGLDAGTVAYAATAADAQALIAQGKRIYTDRPELIAGIADVDVNARHRGRPARVQGLYRRRHRADRPRHNQVRLFVGHDGGIAGKYRWTAYDLRAFA